MSLVTLADPLDPPLKNWIARRLKVDEYARRRACDLSERMKFG